jgi:hypothetical protein
MSKNFKLTIAGQEAELQFKNPNQEELFELDKIYRIIFSEGLKENIITETGLKKKLEKNGDWTLQDDEQIKTLSQNVAELERTLQDQDGTEIEEKIQENLAIVSKIVDMRRKLELKVADKVSLLANSLEGLAKDQRMHLFILLCCCNSNGTRVFEDSDAYQKFLTGQPEMAGRLLTQAYIYDYNADEDLSIDNEEIKYLDRLAKETKKKQVAQEKQSKDKVTAKKKKKIARKSKQVNRV